MDVFPLALPSVNKLLQFITLVAWAQGEVTSAFLYSATASSDTASVGCWMEAEFGGMICLPPQDHMYRPCHLPDGNIQ